MGTYIGVRLLHALIVLALVTVLVFVIAQLIPDDAIMATMAGSVDMSDPAVVAKVRQQFGLHRPILAQYAVWLAHFVRGDWGTSIGTGEKLLDMFLRRLPVTLELFLGASLWSLAIGIPTGVGALKRNSAIDMLLTACSIIDVSIPSFWPSAMPSPSRCSGEARVRPLQRPLAETFGALDSAAFHRRRGSVWNWFVVLGQQTGEVCDARQPYVKVKVRGARQQESRRTRRRHGSGHDGPSLSVSPR